MRIIDQLVYKIDADNSGFNKGVATSEAKAKGFSKAANVAFTALAVGGASLLINKAVQMGREFVSAASDAEETANKFNVTFSDIREEADATAQALSDSFGLSSQKSQQLLSDTGDLLTGFGFTQESALDLSNQVNELAVDLASFTNYSGGAEGASAALTKALLGERESIKSLGIAITEADINQLAEDKGIVGELTRQQKAMLTLELATIQSKNAIGDFARSEESLANQQRILEGNLQDLRVELGNKLLPTVTSVVSGFNDLLDEINGNNSASADLTTSYNNLESAIANYNKVLDEAEGKTDAVTQSMVAQARAQLQLSLQTASDTYRESNRELASYTNTIENSEKWVNRYNKSLEEIAEGTGYTADQLNILTEQERLNIIAKVKGIDEGDRYNTIINSRMSFQQDLIEATTKLTQAEADQESFVNLLTLGYQTNKEATQLLLDAYPELEGLVLANIEAIDKATTASLNHTGALQDEKKALRELKEESTTDETDEQTQAEQDLAYWRAEQTRRIYAQADAARQLALDKAEEERNTRELTDSYIALVGADEARQKALDDANEVIQTNIKYEQDLADWHTEQRRRAYAAADAMRQLAMDKEDNTEETEEYVEQLTYEEKVQREASRQALISADAMRQLAMDTDHTKDSTEDAATAFEEWAETNKETLDSIVQIGNVSTNILNSLGDLYKSQHDARMQQIDEEKAEALESIDEQLQAELERLGLEEDTQIEKLEKRLEKAKEANDQELIDDIETQIARQEVLDEYNQKRIDAEKGFDDERKKIERDAAERQKKIATFEAIINTASGIVEAIPNPFLMAAAATVGGLQLAAIQAQPIPSFDVGTLRVPETTQAVVHQDEMILTRNLADQARQEGITISPSGGGGVPAQIMIYLDKRKLGEAMVDEINSGRSYKIDARVVK
jgi:hypothetical protein